MDLAVPLLAIKKVAELSINKEQRLLLDHSFEQLLLGEISIEEFIKKVEKLDLERDTKNIIEDIKTKLRY